jgi:predicted nucleic acid-binding protein
VSNEARGVQVHDARLAAIMQAHEVRQILTLNQPDFRRFASIQVIHPIELQR